MRNEEVFWTTKDGTKVLVDDMSISHLRNVVKMYVRQLERQRAIIKQHTTPKVIVHGEIASEHAEAYEIYLATGIDILSDDPEDFL